MRLQTLKNCIVGLITVQICQIIFFTMNDTVAGLVMLFGLSIIGLYIFRFINYIRNKSWRIYIQWKQEQNQK